MRIVFCGTGEIGAPALKALLASKKHIVVGVITQPDKPAGRDLKPRMSAIKQIALAQNLSVQQPEKLRDAAALEDLRALAPDLMVVAAYGQILPKSVLETPRLGCLNLHASLLPRHRGASPIHAAILAGDRETGITVMYMDEGLDTGDILLAKPLTIGPDETTGQLHDRLADLAAPCLLEALDLLEQGNAPRVPQDNALATYAAKLKKTDGLLDWCQPAEALATRVRAMSPWPGAYTRLAGQTLKIHSAKSDPASGPPGEILASDPGVIRVGCGFGSLLLESLQLEGRKRLPAAEFLRGHPIAPGTRLDLSFPPAA
ncbi:MAG: methionyl-tRNA formyltransferase [Terrimicrobiaceae bacterium]